MRTGKPFKEYLQEVFQVNPTVEKNFYRELFKLRIGDQIKELRRKKGLNQSELAELVGTSQSTIARLENPDNFSYSLKTLLKIAEALDMELVISFREKKYKKDEKTKSYELNNVVSLEEYREYKIKRKTPYTYTNTDNLFCSLEESIPV